MKSIYVTNILLFVIAICLLAMVSQKLGLIGVSNAQSPPISPPITYVAVLGWNVKQPIPVEVHNPGPENDPRPLLTKPQP
jgi:hypothetical protein